ncbi:uncharacterized protein C19orf44-like [Lingula anatina]|uniref:Uncharacterized protein C19orf44-like n=1 Tax=Lingula anatina TaxID=7574 RepID=A0A1S3HKC2_LINAN|nr:uncharacterized protein C19orf44-like [Lingula anatina]|eukprot:XP_013386472.1 uncharacterized protein C19orf44-like [Lingula anatina]
MEATPTAPLTKSKKNEEKDIQTKSNDQAKDKRPVPKPRKSKQDSVSVESPEPDPLSRMGLQTLDDVLDIDNDPSVPVIQSYLTKETKDESSSSSSEEIILDMSQQSDIVYENDFNKDRKSRPITPRSEAVTPKSEIVSEIKSEIQYQSDFERSQSRISPTPTPRSQSNRYSDDFEHSYQDKSDIGRSRSASPKRSRSNSRSSEQRSRSRSRTDRSSSGTTSLRSSFSQSVSSSSKTETSSRSRKKHKGSSRSPTSRKASYSPRGKHDRSKHKDSYSSSRSGTSKDDDYSRDSNTESYRSSRSRRGHRKSRTKTVRVQTDHDTSALQYQWNPYTVGTAVEGAALGMQVVDPTPVATHAVSAEALEAMTGYSPSVLVLNDMLRQQLQLTKSFLGVQQRIYHSLMGTINNQYQYTTLEDTKKYIRKHRKPKLTFDQALKLVRAEMGEDVR